MQSKLRDSSSVSCPNGFRAVLKTDCRDLSFSFFLPEYPTPRNGLKNPRTSSVVDVLYPTVRNKRVIHQFWTYWKTIRVSLNSSQITQKSHLYLVIIQSFSWYCPHEPGITNIHHQSVDLLFVQTLSSNWFDRAPMSRTITLPFILVIMSKHCSEQNLETDSAKSSPYLERA